MDSLFSKNVLDIVRAIPPGKVTTYGHIASFLGSKKSARMVGRVLSKQKGNLQIPAHRVVNRNGLLTGKHHFEGINLMQDLLKNEGVEIKNNKVVNLKRYLWNPFKDL